MASIFDWSVTAGDNDDGDTDINWLEGQQGQTVNNSARAMMAKVAGMVKLMRAAYTTTNVGNDYTVAIDFTPSALTKGFFGVIRFNAANTGAATLTNGALAAAAIKTATGAALAGGEITANGLYLVLYDTTASEYRIISSLTSVGTQSFTVDDAVNNSRTVVLNLTHTTTGVPATGIGTAINFITESSAGNNEIGAQLSTQMEDGTLGSEDFKFQIRLMQGGTLNTFFQFYNSGVVDFGNYANSTDAGGPIGVKERAGAIVQSGDRLLRVRGYGYDTTDYVPASEISFEVDGTPGVGDMPGRISFKTSPNAAASVIERMRIKETGRVTLSRLGSFEDLNISGEYGDLTIISPTNSAHWTAMFASFEDVAQGPSNVFLKSRNTTPNSFTIVQSGDTVGLLTFKADDGVNYNNDVAEIRVAIDDTPGSNDTPGRIVFSTTPNASNTLVERLRIGNGGYLTTWANTHLIPGMLFKVLTANEAGGNVNTAQPWFPTGGAVSVEADTTYFFEGVMWISRSAGANSHTTGLLFGGTATLTSIMYAAQCGEGDVAAIGDSDIVTANVATLTNIKAASTSTTEQIKVTVQGTVRINAAGTFIPQFQYSAAPGGAPSILANTYFQLTKIGSGTVATQGTWA
jgi:hypothetical protein